MNEPLPLKEAWAAYRNGDHVSSEDYLRMKASLVNALDLLHTHPDAGAMRRVALQDLSTIEAYLKVRRNKSVDELIQVFGKLSFQSPH